MVSTITSHIVYANEEQVRPIQQTPYHFFQFTTLNMVTCSLRQFSMQVDGICNGGVATIKDVRIKNRSCCCGSVECTRVMTIPGPLPKHYIQHY